MAERGARETGVVPCGGEGGFVGAAARSVGASGGGEADADGGLAEELRVEGVPACGREGHVGLKVPV